VRPRLTGITGSRVGREGLEPYLRDLDLVALEDREAREFAATTDDERREDAVEHASFTVRSSPAADEQRRFPNVGDRVQRLEPDVGTELPHGDEGVDPRLGPAEKPDAGAPPIIDVEVGWQ